MALEPEVESSITELLVRVGFRVNADPAYVAQQKKMLNDLVLERNSLIHHDLADFDLNSEESFREWIERLDEQNQRIISIHKEVQLLLDTHSEGFAILLGNLKEGSAERP